MKMSKTKTGLIILVFILNFGFFAQIKGQNPIFLEIETDLKPISSSNTVEKSTIAEVDHTSYEREEWKLERPLRESLSNIDIKGNFESSSYSIASIQSVQYNTHPIIQIDGNADFLTYNFTGRGTPIEPYIIENWNITASHTHLIFISNTDANFEVRYNYLNGINCSFNAVFLKNVTNGLVRDNFILNVEIGVYLEEAHSNEIRTNNIFDTTYDGINLWASNNNYITYNNISNAGLNGFSNGISISYTCNSTWIQGNIIDYVGGWAGIYLGGSYLSYVLNNCISNIINGNGIVLGYWGMKPKDTSAIINNNTIYGSGYRGIRLEFANGNSITKNTVYENGEDGLHLYSTTDNFVELNNIFSNNWDGISIDALSDNNQFYTNMMTNNTIGILNDNSSNNEFFGNGIFDSRAEGFVIYNSANLDLSFNDIMNSWEDGIHAWGTITNLYIGNNTIEQNSWITKSYPDEYRAGIYVGDFNGIIAGNIIFNNQYGIYTDMIAGGQIYGNEIYNNGNNGITLISVNDTIIADNRIIDNGVNGILCVFSNYNIIIVNKIIGNQANGIVLIDSNYNTIENNEITGNSGTAFNPLPPEIKFSIQAVTNGHGVFLDPCIGNVITLNKIYGNAGSGTYLSASSGNEITDNEIVDNNENGVFLEGSSGNKVLRNYIASNGDPELLRKISKGEISLKIEAVTNGHGVFLDPTSENIVSDNVIENNIRNGVQLYLTDDSLISNNKISGNENGIALESSNGNNISGNTIFKNGITSEKRLLEYPFLRYSIEAVTNGHGVFLDPSDYNIIEGNNIFGNSGNGIFLVDSDYTKILYNIISVNLQYGVNIDPTSVSTIVGTNDFYENNFEPGSQARDDGIESFFDHNYWSDWIGEGNYEIDGTANNADENPAESPNFRPGYNFSIPKVIYPNGGESLSNTESLRWENAYSDESDYIKYWLFYSRDGGSSWINIPTELLELITASDGTIKIQYKWDTTTVENGNNYLIKVIAVDQLGFCTFDTSDGPFAIKNEVDDTTTTTKTTTEATTPEISPSWSYIITSIGLVILIGLKRQKR